MRTIRTAIIVLLLPLGFLGGYLIGTHTAGSVTTHVSSGQNMSAQSVAQLQQTIIEYLQGHYYRAVDVSTLGRAGIDGMLSSLNDPWTEYLSPSEVRSFEQELQGSYSGIGASMQMKGGRLQITAAFDGSPARLAGLKAGDQIVSVDGRPTAGLSLAANTAHIKGAAGTKVTLVVAPAAGGQRRTLTLTRKQIDEPLTAERVLHAGSVPVGYVSLSKFAHGAGTQVHAALRDVIAKGARWIIFDLRNDGGGYLPEAVGVASDFMKGGVVVSAQGLHWPRSVLKAASGQAIGLPVVLLVDDSTKSASEIVAGALQDHHRAFLIGTRTFGKGLVQSILALPGGGALKLTTAVYLTPDGRDINKVGIRPDKVVIDDPKTKADEVLQAALRYIAAR